MSAPTASARPGQHSGFKLFATVTAVLNALAVPLLLAGGWLSYGFAASFNMDSNSSVPDYDRVSYTLLGYNYWVGDHVASGPHRPLTWALLWLLIMLAAWGYQVWRHGTGPHGFRLRWGLRVTGAALLLSLLGCLAVLPLAQSAHTGILQKGVHPWIVATVFTLNVRVNDYNDCANAGGCRISTNSTFPNPFAAVLALIALSSVIALMPPRRLSV